MVLLVFWAAACGESPAGPVPQPPPPPPVPPPNRAPTVTAAIPSDTVSVGDSLIVDLSAHFRDPDGDTLTFSAQTSDAAVATVSVVGVTAMVAGVAEGTATVTAAATDPGNLRAEQSFAVTVEVGIERVVVTPDSVTLTAIGDTIRLTAEVFDGAGQVVPAAVVSWSTGDTMVAAVDTAGLVTANGPGSTAIIASAGDAAGQAVVSVVPPPPNRAPTVTAAIPSDTVSVGDSLIVDLSAHFRDPDGDTLTFSAQTSDAAVATVSVVGVTAMVAGVAEGTATVTAAATDPGNLRAEQDFAVTVEVEIERVVVTPDSATLTAIGDTIRLTAGVFDGVGQVVPDAVVSRSTGDPTVAAVDAAGLATANGPGSTAIIASAEGATGQAVVSVVPRAHAVSVSPSDASLVTGDTLHLRATVTDRNGHALPRAEVVWTSSSPGVVEVRATGTPGVGLGSAISEGSATITAASGDTRGTSQVTVSANGERRVLAVLYAATDGPNWKRSDNWLSDAPLDAWHGIQVDAEGRITNLVLQENDLRGPIPPELGALSRLRELNLSRNHLTGTIPGELGSLANLESLRLSHNWGLNGSIPPRLGRLTKLRTLLLSSNQLSGSIPPELGSLSRLTELRLAFNRLTGPIPPELGSLTGLRVLVLSYNELSGPIPPELAALRGLATLAVQENRLTGVLPQGFLEWGGLWDFLFYPNDGLCAPGTRAFVTWLRSIRSTAAWYCNAADMAALVSLYEATGGPDWRDSGGWLGDALLDDWRGVTTDSLGRVFELDLTDNNLAGSVHPTLASLTRMTALRIGGNRLSGPLPLGLARLPLRELDYSDTEVCAPAEASFRDWLSRVPSHRGTGLECGGLSDREILVSLYHATGGPRWTKRDNWMSDAPLGEWHGIRVDDEGRVIYVELGLNNLVGSIPPELGLLDRLRGLLLAYNNLAGSIPPELGSLTRLTDLYAQRNQLEGPIPPELGRLSQLRVLSLCENRLGGEIPPELGTLDQLPWLNLSGNELTGPIPPELGRMTGLRLLELSRNRLAGPIPPSLGDLVNLEGLYLQRNDLSGPLAPEFGNLGGLTHLSLFGNAGLAGPLPTSLTGLRRLREFHAGGTDLCAPPDPDLRLWLREIRIRRVALCEGEAMAYLVQAVQSAEFPVPLVAGRDALLRVFVTAAPSEAEMPPVRATFYVHGAEVYATNIPGGARAIPAEIDESSLSTSANTHIPGHVLQPGLEMVIEVDPEGTLDPSLGVRRRIPETGRLAQDVRTVPKLDLTLIPFLWDRDPDSTTVYSVRDMAADPRNLLWPVHTLLPVGDFEVTAHEPVWSWTNFGPALMRETEAIRVMEGATGYYMGLLTHVPIGLRGSAIWAGRSSWAITDPRIMAHELGHNLRLAHAPCGDAKDADPAFPQADASIGVWGYDFRGGGRLVDPSTRDIMSYCDPFWLSDYYFTNALRHRLEVEASVARPAGPVPSLFLWGGAEVDGQPFLEPAFVVDVPPSLPAGGGDHLLEGRGADGRRLFSVSFDMPEVTDGDGSSVFAFALPVEPGWAGALARITLTGPAGSATLDGASDQPVVILRDPASGRVRGILRDEPGLTPAQAAATAAGLPGADGLEVLFSRGLPESEAWHR